MSSSRILLTLALLLGACDSGDSGSDDVLAAGHLRGTIELDTRTSTSGFVAPVPPDPSEVRIAVAWYGEITQDVTRRPWALQEIPIVSHSDSWPMEFELAITEPPPPDADHYDESGYYQGKFVAYRDNGNGRLDWTPIAADAFIDSIVAYHPHLYLWFYDDGGLKLYMPDSIEPSPPDTPITLLERTDLRSSCHLLEWTPRFSFLVEGGLPDPDEGEQGPWDAQAFPQCPWDMLPQPGSTVACEPLGGSDFQYYAAWSTTDASAFMTETCGPLMRMCWGTRSSPTDPVPWPCPCDSSVYNCVDSRADL